MIDIEMMITQVEEFKKKKIEAIKNQSDNYFKLFEKAKDLRKKKEKGELTREDIEDMAKILCFKDPAYCCKSGKAGKPCINRDSFWYALGLDLDDFEEYKKRCSELFWNFIKEKGVIR